MVVRAVYAVFAVFLITETVASGVLHGISWWRVLLNLMLASVCALRTYETAREIVRCRRKLDAAG